MSFRCDICEKPQDTGVKPISFIADDRVAHYENTYRRGYKDVKVSSVGWEIVKEQKVCQPCFDAAGMPDEDEGLDSFDDN